MLESLADGMAGVRASDAANQNIAQDRAASAAQNFPAAMPDRGDAHCDELREAPDLLYVVCDSAIAPTAVKPLDAILGDGLTIAAADLNGTLSDTKRSRDRGTPAVFGHVTLANGAVVAVELVVSRPGGVVVVARDPIARATREG